MASLALLLTKNKDRPLAYLDSIYENTRDPRLLDEKVRKGIIGRLEDACKITCLSSSDLLGSLDFKQKDVTIEALESFLAELRSIFWLRDFSFTEIVPLQAKKKLAQHDFNAKYGDKTCAIEVFCLTQKHGQQKNPALNVYINFSPGFSGSKFGRDFISMANKKKNQLDSSGASIKILLCVVNSAPMVALHTKRDWGLIMESLYEDLGWKGNYYLGLLVGVSVNGLESDTIYPELPK